MFDFNIQWNWLLGGDLVTQENAERFKILCDEISSIFDVRNTKVDVYWYLKLRGIFYDIADLLKAYKWALQKREKSKFRLENKNYFSNSFGMFTGFWMLSGYCVQRITHVTSHMQHMICCMIICNISQINFFVTDIYELNNALPQWCFT